MGQDGDAHWIESLRRRRAVDHDLNARCLHASVAQQLFGSGSEVEIRGEASFRTYLFTIARHELYRFFRQRSQQRDRLDFGVSSLFDLETSATGKLQRQERKLALERALAQLSLDDQMMLELFYTEELDSRALAQVFGIEPASVRSRLHRARAELERLMSSASVAQRAPSPRFPA
jgi:RNA polymerase sigma-70 factor (ECF subfamily)